MSKIQSALSAREVDRRLREAVAELRRSEQRAVLWFAEVLHRNLYRDLGFGSIQQYAEIALGFGPAKTAQFVRLARAFRELPRLRASVARGELTWTQARTVAGVATPGTEVAWLTAAKEMSSRGLEEQVRVARRRARVATAGKGQARLGLERVGSVEGNRKEVGVGIAKEGNRSGVGSGTGTRTRTRTRTRARTRHGSGKKEEEEKGIAPPPWNRFRFPAAFSCGSRPSRGRGTRRCWRRPGSRGFGGSGRSCSWVHWSFWSRSEWVEEPRTGPPARPSRRPIRFWCGSVRRARGGAW